MVEAGPKSFPGTVNAIDGHDGLDPMLKGSGSCREPPAERVAVESQGRHVDFRERREMVNDGRDHLFPFDDET